MSPGAVSAGTVRLASVVNRRLDKTLEHPSAATSSPDLAPSAIGIRGGSQQPAGRSYKRINFIVANCVGLVPPMDPKTGLAGDIYLRADLIRASPCPIGGT